MSSGDFMRRQNRRIRIAISLSVRPPKGIFTAFVWNEYNHLDKYLWCKFLPIYLPCFRFSWWIVKTKFVCTGISTKIEKNMYGFAETKETFSPRYVWSVEEDKEGHRKLLLYRKTNNPCVSVAWASNGP